MDFSIKKTVVIILAVFALANLLILDVLIFRTDENDDSEQALASVSESESEQQTQDSCGEDCQDYIDEQISQLKTDVIPQNIQSNSVEEVYIPLGTATTQFANYQSVPGLEAQIDLTKYPNIATATFEASVTNPNASQQVWLQLFDATNNHPVWYSQVTYQGGGSSTLISSPITLSTGNVTYQVQAQTQLQAPTQITNARVHLILE